MRKQIGYSILAIALFRLITLQSDNITYFLTGPLGFFLPSPTVSAPMLSSNDDDQFLISPTALNSIQQNQY